MTRRLSILVSALLLAWPANSQSVNPPAFEVADIKPSDPATLMPGKGRILPGGRLELPGMAVKDFIMFAYGVQENMVTGAPKWAETERFDVIAKAPSAASPETIRPMFQSLLAERFKLQIHREEKMMPAYVLTIGKRAAKYQQGNGDRQQCNWTTIDSGLVRRECHNLTMAELARQLPGWGGIGIDLPVVDETGLKGPYDFQLDVGMAKGRNEGRPGESLPMPDSGPTIFEAFDRIGLKLEARKMPMQAIVIDHVEPPSGN